MNVTLPKGLDRRIVGIVYAFDPGDEYELVRDAGIEWIRLATRFPWSDRMFGTLSGEYLAAKEKIEEAAAAGLKVMPVTPGLGGYRFVKDENRTRWVDSWPDLCGLKGSDEYYRNVRETCRWIAEDLEGLAGPLWQIMNEIDIEIFRGEYSEQVAATRRRRRRNTFAGAWRSSRPIPTPWVPSCSAGGTPPPAGIAVRPDVPPSAPGELSM